LINNMYIGGVLIGCDAPCFVIAEAGVNHGGDIKVAHQLVDVAAKAGANAIKFQTFNADRLASMDARRAQYQLDAMGQGGSQHDMLKRLELSNTAHCELQAHCQELDLIFLSTPFDEQSADFLESMNVPAYKISSGDLTNHPLIAHVSRKNKPIILSTGMATLDEVAEVLQCVSNYPAEPGGINLRVMQTYVERFGVPVGYSDHTPGITVAIVAVSLGAAIIEKHFTLDRNLAGPDHRASLEPDELTEMIVSIRVAEKALGNGIKMPLPEELPLRDLGRRSLHWSHDLAAGHRTTAGDFVALRPGTGLPPYAVKNYSGRTIKEDVHAGQMVSGSVFYG
jgi:N,N'-diacetyllegionaminate synthase